MGPMLLAYLAEVGIISWRDISGKTPNHTVAGLPLPADYLAATAVFGALGLASRSSGASKVTGLIGWAIVLATALNAWNPSAPAGVSKPTTSTSASTKAGTNG